MTIRRERGNLRKQRSPFSLNTMEIAVAIGVSITTWFGLRNFLWNIGPWPFYDLEYYQNEPLPFWFTVGRQELFGRFAIPMAVIMGISAIFLIRGIRNQEIKFFNRISNMALAWPIFSFIGINILSFCGIFCFLPGLIFAIVAFADSYKSESKWGGVVALAWNVVWIFMGVYYSGQWWSVYGD